MPKGIIIIFGDCREPNAKGDYQLAAALGHDFVKEITDQKLSHQVEVVLTTSSDAIHKYHQLYTPLNTTDMGCYLDVMGTPIRTQSLEDLIDHDEKILAFIDANHCRGPVQGVLEHVLSPNTKVLAIYGPHQPDFGSMPQPIVHASFDGGRTGREIYNYYQRSMTFYSEGIGGSRLGVLVQPMSEVTTMDSDQEKIFKPYPSGDYSFLYMSASFGNLDQLLSEFISLSQAKNFIFVGNYESDFKKAVVRLPYAAHYQLDDGRMGENVKPGDPVSFHSYKSIPANVMRYLINDSSTLIAVTGASTLLEALLAGKIPYYQTTRTNQVLVDSFQGDVKRRLTSSTASMAMRQNVIELLSILFAPKPLGLTDKRRAQDLLAQPNIISLTSAISRTTIEKANGSIARKLLPSILSKGNPNALNQVNLACFKLRKPGEYVNPDYNKALRRAAFWGKYFELKILLTHAASISLDISNADSKSRMPLHWALIGRQSQAALAIIDSGASLSRMDIDGLSPLHYALTNDLITVATQLIEMGETVISIQGDHEININSAEDELQCYSPIARACIARCISMEAST